MKPNGAHLAALAIVLVVGTLALWTPLSVDQAIFTYGGRAMVAGETLYVDYWDVKPPGIFLFYALAGLIFRFDEPGIHLFEVFWMLAATALLTAVALGRVERPWTAAVAPVASIGFYLAFAGPDHRTQVEALAVLPLALALLAASALAERPEARRWCLALGAAAGLLTAFKPVYLPLPAAFALLAAFAVARRRGRAAGRLLPGAMALGAVGLAAVWLPIAAYFAWRGGLEELLWTTFQYPREALGDFRAPTERLAGAARWAAGTLWPWIPLAVVGLVPPRRGGPVERWGAAVYLAVAAGLIAIQTISWWPYHFVLLFPAIGLLASFGLDRLLAVRGRVRLLAAALGLALLVPPAWALAGRSAATLARLRAAAALDSDAPLAVRLDPRYLRFWEGARVLREGGLPGTAYVFGDQRLLLLSERRQAIPVHGHGWALFPRSFWRRLPAELMAARPAYVFVSPYDRSVLEAGAPELVEFFEREYVAIRQVDRGLLLARSP